MDADYGAQYRDLFTRHWWWRARETVILDALARHQRPGGWGNVLDVGCGDGLFFDTLRTLPGVALVEGVEPAAALVASDGPHRRHIHVAPFDASFDVQRRYGLILMLDVLEHLPDPVASLRHAVTLLEPDGIYLATVPAFMALWTRHDDLNHHVTRYDRPSLARAASDAGLEIVEMRYFFRWTAAAKLVTRFLEWVRPAEPAAPRTPAPAVNSLLRALSRLEERLLGPLGVPFGSSLLVVGRRARREKGEAIDP